MHTIISFDLDGTLVNKQFADEIWLHQIPLLYAESNDIDYENAKNIVEKEYSKIGSDSLKWYDIHYWLNFLNLEYYWEDILKKGLHKLQVYPEVETVLKALSKDYTMIIISNAAKEFIDLEMDFLKLHNYFYAVYSAVSDFRKTKKDISTYLCVTEKLSIKPESLTHIGDTYEYDFIAAKKAGVKAYFLNRNAENIKNSYTVKNLIDFQRKLRDI